MTAGGAHGGEAQRGEVQRGKQRKGEGKAEVNYGESEGKRGRWGGKGDERRHFLETMKASKTEWEGKDREKEGGRCRPQTRRRRKGA